MFTGKQKMDNGTGGLNQAFSTIAISNNQDIIWNQASYQVIHA